VADDSPLMDFIEEYWYYPPNGLLRKPQTEIRSPFEASFIKFSSKIILTKSSFGCHKQKRATEGSRSFLHHESMETEWLFTNVIAPVLLGRRFSHLLVQ
jgi:hypothetical protein